MQICCLSQGMLWQCFGDQKVSVAFTCLGDVGRTVTTVIASNYCKERLWPQQQSQVTRHLPAIIWDSSKIIILLALTTFGWSITFRESQCTSYNVPLIAAGETQNAAEHWIVTTTTVWIRAPTIAYLFVPHCQELEGHCPDWENSWSNAHKLVWWWVSEAL